MPNKQERQNFQIKITQLVVIRSERKENQICFWRNSTIAVDKQIIERNKVKRMGMVNWPIVAVPESKSRFLVNKMVGL